MTNPTPLENLQAAAAAEIKEVGEVVAVLQHAAALLDSLSADVKALQGQSTAGTPVTPDALQPIADQIAGGTSALQAAVASIGANISADTPATPAPAPAPATPPPAAGGTLNPAGTPAPLPGGTPPAA